MAVCQVDRAEVRRLVEQELRRPGAVPATPDVSLIKEGEPSDKDFPQPPKDGTLAFDKKLATLYIRVGGEWKVA